MILDKAQYANYILSKISGNNSGILSEYIVLLEPSEISLPMYEFLDLKTPSHSQIISKGMKSTFHLTGYGDTKNDALMRFIGEAIERYSLISSEYDFNGKLAQKYIFIGSLNQIEKKYRAYDINYLNHYDHESRLYWNKKSNGMLKDIVINEETPIKWIKLKSIDLKWRYYPWNQVFISSFEYAPYHSFSTGTACHEDINQAKLSAIIENLQIDGFMYSWYTGKNKKYFTINELPENIINMIKSTLNKYILDHYDIYIFDYSKNTSMKMHNFGVFLIATNENTFPCIVFGNQAGTSFEKTIKRGIQEALAVYSIFTTTPERKEKKKNYHIFDNLEDNVEYYAQCGTIRNKNLINIFKNSSKYTKQEIIENINKKFDSIEIFNWVEVNHPETAFLEILPKWLDLPQIHVFRCIMPKLLGMCLPSFPKTLHPRLKNEKIYKVAHALP